MVMDELFQSDRAGNPVRNMLESFEIQLLIVGDREDTKLVTSWETDPSQVGLDRGETVPTKALFDPNTEGIEDAILWCVVIDPLMRP